MAVLLAAAVFTSAMFGSGQPEPTEETLSAAADASVDVTDLMGAMNTTGLDARPYLVAVGELAPPKPPGWPIGGALGQRIYCIEGIESHHGAAMYNRAPVWNGEHAQGWLGFLPSTARSVGAVIGDRASEWVGAAGMLARGRGREFYGIAAGIC